MDEAVIGGGIVEVCVMGGRSLFADPSMVPFVIDSYDAEYSDSNRGGGHAHRTQNVRHIGRDGQTNKGLAVEARRYKNNEPR